MNLKNRFYPEAEEIQDFKANIADKKAKMDAIRGIADNNESSVSTIGPMKPIVGVSEEDGESPDQSEIPRNAPMNDKKIADIKNIVGTPNTNANMVDSIKSVVGVSEEDAGTSSPTSSSNNTNDASSDQHKFGDNFKPADTSWSDNVGKRAISDIKEDGDDMGFDAKDFDKTIKDNNMKDGSGNSLDFKDSDIEKEAKDAEKSAGNDNTDFSKMMKESKSALSKGQGSKKIKRRPECYKIYYKDILRYKKTGKIDTYTSFMLYPDKVTPKDIQKIAVPSSAYKVFAKQKDFKRVIKANGVIGFSGNLDLTNPSNKPVATFYSPTKNEFYIKNDGALLSDSDFKKGMKPTSFATYWKRKYFYDVEYKAALNDIYKNTKVKNAKNAPKDVLDESKNVIGDFITTPTSDRVNNSVASRMLFMSESALNNSIDSEDTRFYMFEKACALVKLQLMKETGQSDELIKSMQETNVNIEKDLRHSNGYVKEFVNELQPQLNKMVLKMTRNYQRSETDRIVEESMNDSNRGYGSLYIEAANIDNRMKPIITKLNQKGYKTKYSSPGYPKEYKKADNNRDGVYYNKLYSTGRLMFDDNYSLPKAPKYWVMRVVEGKSYLDVKPISYDPKYGNADEAFSAWREKYLGTLERWVDTLPSKSEAKDGVDTDATRSAKKVLESANYPSGALHVISHIDEYNFDESTKKDIIDHCKDIISFGKYLGEIAFIETGLDDVDAKYYIEAAVEPNGESQFVKYVSKYPELSQFGNQIKEIDDIIKTNKKLSTPTTEEKVLDALSGVIGIMELIVGSIVGGMAASPIVGGRTPGSVIMGGIKQKTGSMIGKGVFGALCSMVAVIILQMTVFKFINNRVTFAQIDAAIRRLEKIARDDPSKKDQCDKLITKLENAKDVIKNKKARKVDVRNKFMDDDNIDDNDINESADVNDLFDTLFNEYACFD